MSKKNFPPSQAIAVTENDRHMKSTASACRMAAVAQSVVTLVVVFALWKVYAWKDLDYALHIAFLSLGLMAIVWLVYLFILSVLTLYSLLCSVFLFRAAFVFSLPDKLMVLGWWIEAVYWIFPFGTLVGIYISRNRKKWLQEGS